MEPLRVAMITADWSWGGQLGGSGFHRIGQPAKALTERGGVEVIVTDGFNVSQEHGVMPHAVSGDLDSGVEGCNIVVFQRCMQDYVPRATAAAQAAGQIVIQDVDDWYWGLATSNHAFTAGHPKINPTVNVNHYKRSLAAADMLTVSTRYLAERLAHLKRPIALLPNMVDLSLYTVNDVRPTSTNLTVGWTGGIAWRSGDLETIAGVLSGWLRSHDAEFIHGGAHEQQPHTAAELLRLHPDTPVTERPLVTPDKYPTLFAGMDIFVAPLSDRPFNQSKSSVKLLEAAAAGVPYVASRVGPYAEWDGGGRTAKNPAQWRQHLDRLADPDVRQAQRDAQLDRVATHDVAVRWQDWALVYEQALRFRQDRYARTVHQLDLLETELSRRGVLT